MIVYSGYLIYKETGFWYDIAIPRINIPVKKKLRTLFSPILGIFESGTEPFVYKSSHRTILVFMGVLFFGLATLVFFLAQGADAGYLLPVLIFGGGGIICLLIGLIGTNRAVAKIWGSR